MENSFLFYVLLEPLIRTSMYFHNAYEGTRVHSIDDGNAEGSLGMNTISELRRKKTEIRL